MKTLMLAASLFLMLFTCGCGSNGGAAGNTPTPTGTPVSLAKFKGYFMGYTTAGHPPMSFNLTGTDTQGGAWSGTYTLVSDGPTTTFENQNVTKSSTQMVSNAPASNIFSNISSNISKNISDNKYFIKSNGNLYKITNSLGISYIPTNYTMPSSPKNVGDFGNLAALSGSDGSTLNIAWELSPEFNGNSLMIISTITRDIFNIIKFNEVDTFYLDRGGNPYKLAITVTTGGVTVTMTGNKI